MKEKQLRVMVIGVMMVTGTCFAGELRIRAVSLATGHPSGEVFAQDAAGKEKAAKIEVKTFLNHEFQTIDFKSNSLVFTTDGDSGSVNDEEKVLGRIEIPDKLKSGILLFRPGQKDKAPAVEITDDSAKVFPAGSTKVINLSSEAMRVELETENFDCEAESEIVISDQPVNKRNASGMRAYRKKGDDWVQIKSGSWPHPGKKRVLRVISISPVTKQVEIRGLRDISNPTN